MSLTLPIVSRGTCWWYSHHRGGLTRIYDECSPAKIKEKVEMTKENSTQLHQLLCEVRPRAQQPLSGGGGYKGDEDNEDGSGGHRVERK